MQKLKNLSHELDFELGSMSCRIETLNDINTMLSHLREDMDKAVYNGNERYYYHEHHRMVRVLSELYYYTIKELTEDHQKAGTIRDEIFNITVNDSLSAGNTVTIV